MREIRTSGSEGGAERSSVPTPYRASPARGAAIYAAPARWQNLRSDAPDS
jgi:hypothetical protein